MDGNPQQGEGSDAASAEGSGDDAATSLVERVLRARDHYAAIGTARSAGRDQLCRAYVETAVKVHPAVNVHADAARAFLRATAAWAALRAEDTRRRYDAELQKDFIVPPAANLAQFQSLEDARAIFTEAWNECLSGEVGSNMTEFAQVLSRAQNLVNDQPQASAGRPLQAAASGVAVSFGLWVAGTAAAAHGFGTVGSLARRVALVQGCSQMAMGSIAAYQQPEVREAVSSGMSAVAEPVRACASNAKTAMRMCPMSLPGPCCDVPLKLSSWCEQLPSCLPRLRPGEAQLPREGEDEASDSDSSSDEAPIKKGDAVCIVGLRSAVELNGKSGVVTGFDRTKGRYMVRMLPIGADNGGPQGASGDSKDVKLIKGDNLVRSSVPSPASVQEFI